MKRHHVRQCGLLVTSLLVATSSAWIGCSNETAGPIVEQKTAVEHGEVIYNDSSIAGTELNTYSCATCHGETTPDGPIKMGGSLAGATKRTSYWAGQEVDLLRAVNACLYYFMLKDKAWTADDEEARALYAYLEFISQDAPGDALPFTVVTDIVDLPPGDKTRGQKAYQRACATCHGAAHTGAMRLVERAPILPEQTLSEHPLGEYTADERRLVFVEKVRYGAFISYTGQMPPFSLEHLSDDDMADILEYLDLYNVTSK
ncbi:MAG: c-type cytochrome [Polyangiaceae bacterium]|nr:c-type cytochrome [Polyangiaceae bacterium]